MILYHLLAHLFLFFLPFLFVNLIYFYSLCHYIFFSFFFHSCVPFIFIVMTVLVLLFVYFFLRPVSFDFIPFTFFNIYFLGTLISALWYSREAIVIQLFKFIKYLLTLFNRCMDLLSINLLFGFCIILGLMITETAINVFDMCNC